MTSMAMVINGNKDNQDNRLEVTDTDRKRRKRRAPQSGINQCYRTELYDVTADFSIIRDIENPWQASRKRLFFKWISVAKGWQLE
jgi:hypothetical protein